MLKRIFISSAVLTLTLLPVHPEAQAPSCCGECIDNMCIQWSDSDAARYLLRTSSELFFGTVVAQELVTCCEHRADVTFMDDLRWKGAEKPRLVVRTWSCSELYPFVLGHKYLISAKPAESAGGPAVLQHCYVPLDGAAAVRVNVELRKLREEGTIP